MKRSILFILSVIVLSCNGNAQKNKSNSGEEYPVSKSEAEWKEILSPREFDVLRKGATERPYSSDLLDVEQPGTFVCAACGNELYKTKHKFDSGTGWPSFDRAIEGGVAYGADRKLGYERNEIHCADCGGHLGHLFNDGPAQTTGKRHCINGFAMDFIPESKEKNNE
jgi:peptide-methionine (R)-S-oxide reductase